MRVLYAPTCSWSSVTRALLKGDALVTRALKWALAVIHRPPQKASAFRTLFSSRSRYKKPRSQHYSLILFVRQWQSARLHPLPLWPRARWEWTWTAFSAALNIQFHRRSASGHLSPCDDDFLSVICVRRDAANGPGGVRPRVMLNGLLKSLDSNCGKTIFWNNQSCFLSRVFFGCLKFLSIYFWQMIIILATRIILYYILY